LSIRTFLSKVTGRGPTLSVELAEQLHTEGRQADAASMFRQLAEGGDRQAQLRLGQLYERGEGVLQNFIEAVRWFRAAADQGCVPAMARLGEIYLTGLAPPNVATPAALQSLESGAGSSLLKRLYPEGLAVAQDTEQALK
jgi:uncharacterized protein